LRRYDGVNSVLRNRFYAWRDETLTAGYDDLVRMWFDQAARVVFEGLAVDQPATRVPDEDKIQALARILPNGIPQEALDATDPDEFSKWVVAGARLDLSNRYQDAPEFARDSTIRTVFLNVCDTAWRSFLDDLEVLRGGIHLRAYGQRDPQQEYASESHRRYRWLADEFVVQGVERLMELYVLDVDVTDVDDTGFSATFEPAT
jgi:preprotein translocase subunit SecA